MYELPIGNYIDESLQLMFLVAGLFKVNVNCFIGMYAISEIDYARRDY